MTLRHLDLFSGIGGFSLASNTLGFNTVEFVELDEFAGRILSRHWPDVPIHKDIKTFNASKYRGKIDLLTAGVPCFVAGTKILTQGGYRNIEDVSVGEEVLTHKGRWRKVTSVMSRNDGELYRVKAQGVAEVITTAEHPFYGRQFHHHYPTLEDGRRTKVRCFDEPSWIEAQDLGRSETYLSQVLPEEQESEHSVNLCWLIGRYLADGWLCDRKDRPAGSGRVVICCNKSEKDYLEERIHAAGFENPSVVEERTVFKFHIQRNEFYQLLLPFGRGAANKCIPGWVLELPKEKAISFLEGYISGDGFWDEKSRSCKISTTSESLAYSISLLAQRAYDVIATVIQNKTKNHKIIEGRLVNQKDFYTIQIPYRNRSGFIEGAYGWKLCRSAKPIGRGRVYNISVEEDESYCANGAVVHNCQSFSYAGKRKGKKDTRYLWPEALGVIKQARPAYVLIENVAGVVNVALDTWELDLANEGYATRSFEIPAAAVEAHHQRARIWLVGKLLHDADPYNHRKRPESERQHEGSEDTERSVSDGMGSRAGVVADTGLSEPSQRLQQAGCGEERQNTRDETRSESSSCSGAVSNLLADSHRPGGEQDQQSAELRSGSSEQSSGDCGLSRTSQGEEDPEVGDSREDSLSDPSSTGTRLETHRSRGQGRQSSGASESALLSQGDRSSCPEGSGASGDDVADTEHNGLSTSQGEHTGDQQQSGWSQESSDLEQLEGSRCRSGVQPAVADPNSKRHSARLGAEVGGSDERTGEEAQSGSTGCSSSGTGDVADSISQSVRVQGHRPDAQAQGGVQGTQSERQRLWTDPSQCSSVMADTKQSGLEGLHEHGASVSGRDSGTHLGDEGGRARAGEDVSDTKAHGLQGSRVGHQRSKHSKKDRQRDGELERTCPGNGAEPVSDTDNLRLQGEWGEDHPQGRQDTAGSAGLCNGAGSEVQGEGSSFESELGGSSTRVSTWVDYSKRWREGTWEEGIPRVTLDKQHRVHRLKALGNSVVPAVAYEVIKAIQLDLEKERKQG